jgi:SAM-dependent methyltransferase
LTPDSLAFLTSPAGERLLADLAHQPLTDADTLAVMSALRKVYPSAQAAAAVEQTKLRRAAAEKFGADAAVMFFTRDALEQASHPAARRWRAAQLSGHVVDAGCGIGADSLTYAQRGCDVLGLDLDPLRVALAEHNAAALGLSDRARFAVHDTTTGLPGAPDWAFFDPARRDARGQRIHHVERYLPPLSTVRRWPNAQRVMVKLSPGVALDQISGYGGEVAFISVNGDLKEAVLVPSGAAQTHRAVLCDGESVHEWAWHALDAPAPLTPAPSGWLIEADPALIRAGLVQHAALAWGAAQIDETLAYLVADQPPMTPWARAWRILDAMPFNLKKLKAYLSAHGVGSVTVKKRGHAMTPDELMSALKLRGGGESRTLVLTRLASQPYVLVCADYAPPSADA